MNYYKLNKTEEVELLVNLLNTECRERAELAKQIHLQCGNVSALLRFIEVADRKFEQKKLNKNHISQILDIAKTIHVELRELQYSIYPTGSSFTGLVNSLHNFIKSCQIRFNTEIEFTCIFNQDLEIESLKEVTMYIIFTEIIEFACFQKVKRIGVRLELQNNILRFDLSKLSKEKMNEELDTVLQNVLAKIYSKLIWQRVEISSDTNWKDRFSICFPHVSKMINDLSKI